MQLKFGDNYQTSTTDFNCRTGVKAALGAMGLKFNDIGSWKRRGFIVRQYLLLQKIREENTRLSKELAFDLT